MNDFFNMLKKITNYQPRILYPIKPSYIKVKPRCFQANKIRIHNQENDMKNITENS